MSWFSRFNPTPGFPDYTGPYQVGTVDVEIPAASLPSSLPLPENAPSTVAFRIFYPCDQSPSSSRPVRWIPSPQRATVSAFTRFLGANSRFAEVFSYFPTILYYITIPAHRNAPLLSPPTKNKRWPVMFFSHGLAGSRNMYAHMCGSLSSHGMVVIAMDHRDGSSPIQYIRATETTESKIIDPISLSHSPSPEVYEGRDKQLRIRLWEVATAHTAVLNMDKGQKLNNLDENTSHSRKERVEVLSRFTDMLDVHEPGKIAFGGHSFGACTTIQLLKTVFYSKEKPSNAQPLLESSNDADLTKQITSKTPTALLDLWCLPLRSPSQSWLWERPLPAYTPGGAGGKSIVSVLSQGFFNWSGNCNDVKRAISPPKGYNGSTEGPYCFYPANSQHFSQSDFGILFPNITRKFLKAEEPERILKLNMRAVLQMLRENGIEIAATSKEDMELTEDTKTGDTILTGEGIKGWIPANVDESTTKGRVNVAEDVTQAPTDEASLEM